MQSMMAIFIAIVATRRNRTQYVIYPYNFDYRNFRTLNDDDIRHLLTNKSTNYGNFAFNQIRWLAKFNLDMSYEIRWQYGNFLRGVQPALCNVWHDL